MTIASGRNAAEMPHVYAVVSRRAKGVSVGIDLNTNRACNWRCIYCQVPDLVRAKAPPVDIGCLSRELTDLLESITHGDYMARHVPEGLRTLSDIAIAGSGEPTLSKQFDQVVEAVLCSLQSFDLVGKVKIVLITNGSQMHVPEVQRGIAAMSKMGGEVWFKLDSATPEGRRGINGAGISTRRVYSNLRLAAGLCRTRIQTMVLAVDGIPPSEQSQQAWLQFVGQVLEKKIPIVDVLLYGLDRPSAQSEASRLENVPRTWIERFASRIESLGLPVQINP